MISDATILTKPTTINYRDNLYWIFCGQDVLKSAIYSSIILFFACAGLFSLVEGVTFRSTTPFAIKFALAMFLGVFLIFALTITFCQFRLSREQLIVVWKFTDDDVSLCDKTGSAIKTPWTQIKKITFKKKGVLVYYKPRGSRWIPERSFSDAQIAALKGLVATKL